MSQTVPIDFVKRAKKHVEATGEPLLEYRLDEYRDTIYVDAEGNLTTFTSSGYELPPQSWGEYMEYQGWDEAALRKWGVEKGHFDPPPDDEADEEERKLDEEEFEDTLNDLFTDPFEYFPNWESEKYGDVSSLLQELGIEKEITFVDGDGNPVESDGEVRELFVRFGSLPGYPGVDSSVVSSRLAVSCLQYVLDEKRAGIQIEYVKDPWG